MAEKPILFNTEMVKAILDDRKTQTRRLIKPQPPCVLRKMTDGHHAGEWHLYQDSPMMNLTTNSPWGAQYSPPYQPGNILWVRETWCKWWLPHGEWSYSYKATSPYGNTAPAMPDSDDEPFSMPWRPSIHMPKEAARLFLRVTGVRCERLRDITARDAFNEGTGKLFLEDNAYGDKDYECDLDDEYGMAREQFAWLWESTLRKDDLERYGWWANPWVWVIEFERCSL